MRTPQLYLAGLASYLPASVAAEDAVAAGWYDEHEWRNSGWTGAAVAGRISAPDMAVDAANQALARSGLDRAEIALLLHASVGDQGPDYWSPHQYVLRHTVGGSIPAAELRQGCNGALTALELAYGYLCAGHRTAALVTGADNFGVPRFDRWRYASGANPGRGSIMGDAATAAVLSTVDGFARVRAMASVSLPELEEMNRPEGPLFPPALTFDRPVDVAGRQLSFARRFPKAALAAKQAISSARTELGLRTIAEAGISPADIARATHVFAGGEGYLRSVLAPIGIDPARGMLAFGRDLGHLSVNDHFAALTHLVVTRQVAPGDHVLMISNGVGVSVSAAVVEILSLPEWATGRPESRRETV
ncbi:ketoacyl-ACP synthase III family protein [Micromonospora sp. WMMD967]|uniref:ketoacyl-ACP synthase III family protein n=1 Tax=Micromonospora sp. WMMD967 TaxID=3016101 RepID=UPI002417B2B2|nr:ketoacyl-ACP synthase III family protein [Micromonospora sp. WMMD967]MDG4836504.1 ketoacyl-ACP synthase III family protein [Micromonospora sp. WMMD967]